MITIINIKGNGYIISYILYIYFDYEFLLDYKLLLFNSENELLNYHIIIYYLVKTLTIYYYHLQDILFN